MSTFDNLCEVLPYIQNDIVEKDKRKKAIEETLKFLIENRSEQYTFTELAEAIFQNTKEKVRMSFHGQGITGDSVGTNYVLASANEVLSYFWNYKQGNKQFKTPPISSNVVTTGNKSNMGAWGFVKDYLEVWYEESEYQKHTTDGTCDEFVREQIRNFERWDDIIRMLFEENIPLNKFLDEDVSKCTSVEREALHNIMQLKLMSYLQQYEPKKERHITNENRKIDIYLAEKNVMIEIKIANHCWDCIRQSNGQLMEYDYLLGKQSHLICVGNYKPENDGFKEYLHYVVVNNALLKTLVYVWEDVEKEEFVCYNPSTKETNSLKDFVKAI